MLRTLGLAGTLLIVSVHASPGVAQTAPLDSEVISCPRGGLSVYYARGEAIPSEQATLLIARIGDEASRCQPEGIDLVSEIDVNRDGEDAIRLAMARLNNVAERLVAGGYPVDRIRLAAQSIADKDMRAPVGGITVYFRKSGAEADAASVPSSSKPSPSGLGVI